jgi:ribonuclease M5
MNEVVVVEGKNDTHAIRRAVYADTIETNGSAVPAHILAEIARVSKLRGVIVFTDPDAAGERIRRIISRKIPEVKHAFLPRELAKRAGKVGVEFAPPEVIRDALQCVRTQQTQTEKTAPPLSWAEYIALDFTGRPHSAQLREQTATQLGIGYGNAKQFYQRLILLQITRDELFGALAAVQKGQPL